MTHNHTPGPWSTDEDDHDAPHQDIKIRADRQRSICTLWIDDAPVPDWNAEQLANARLIVKAPELLDALQEMYNEYCSAMRSEFDFPGRPWTPERDNDEPAIRARALLVQLGGTP